MLQALIMFKELYPGYRTKEVEKCIGNAATFIESRQEEDGSWFVRVQHLLTYRNTQSIFLLILQQFVTKLVVWQVRHLGCMFHLWDILFS